MKIKIPIWAADLDDGIKLFLAFFLRVSQEDTNRTRYYVHRMDIRYLVGSFMIQPNTIIAEIPNSRIRLGSASDDHWLFEWVKKPTETTLWEPTDKRSIAIWGYVISRDSAGNLVEENKSGKIPPLAEGPIQSEEDMEFFEFAGNIRNFKSPTRFKKKYVPKKKQLPELDVIGIKRDRREGGMTYAALSKKWGHSVNMCYRTVNPDCPTHKVVKP